MIYNVIMVQLDLDSGCAPRLKFARDLASLFEANLIGFAAGNIHPILAPPPGVIMDGEFMRLEAKDIESRLDALRSEFEAEAENGGRQSLRTLIGDPTHGLAKAARAADLVIAGPSTDGGEGDIYRSIDVGELILSVGRPVLIPKDDAEPLRAKNILVAWKDTREARRAVVDAMPFLVHARQVLVATLENQQQDLATESATDVVRYLINHGAKARAEVFNQGGAEEGKALVDIAKQLGGDLIVSGAYGHSRLREWFFGGVTRSLLSDGSVNRLMSY